MLRDRRLHRSALVAAIITVAAGWGAEAHGAPIVGGETELLWGSKPSFDAVLLFWGAGGNTEADIQGEVWRFFLPVTGGDATLAPPAGTIQHDDFAFLSLMLRTPTGEVAFGRVEWANMEFDLTNAVVRGDGEFLLPSRPGDFPFEDLPLFALTDCSTSALVDPCLDVDGTVLETGFGMRLTPEAVSLFRSHLPWGGLNPAWETMLDVHSFIAFPRLVFVPESTTAALLGAGLGALVHHRRRRGADRWPTQV